VAHRAARSAYRRYFGFLACGERRDRTAYVGDETAVIERVGKHVALRAANRHHLDCDVAIMAVQRLVLTESPRRFTTRKTQS
jgi:hypothetical protein